MARGYFQRATVYEKYFDHNAEPTYEYFSAEQLHSLAHDIFLTNSDKALRVEVAHLLTSGRRLFLRLWFYGTKFSQSVRVNAYGPILIECDRSDLRSSIRDKLEENGILAPFERSLHDIDEEQLELLHKQIDEDEHRNARELFYTVCALTKDMQSSASSAFADSIGHAFSWTNSGYTSIMLNSGIFHREVGEFARDFVRIYLEYNRGITCP